MINWIARKWERAKEKARQERAGSERIAELRLNPHARCEVCHGDGTEAVKYTGKYMGDAACHACGGVGIKGDYLLGNREDDAARNAAYRRAAAASTRRAQAAPHSAAPVDRRDYPRDEDPVLGVGVLAHAVHFGSSGGDYSCSSSGSSGSDSSSSCASFD